jgi:hypothetical protein
VTRNPSLLGDERDGLAARLDYDPSGGYSGMFATVAGGGSSGYGLSLNSLGAGTLTLGAGTGGRIFHIGVNASLNGTINPGDAAVGVGTAIGDINGLRLAATLSNVLQFDSARVTLGLGYAAAKNFQIEADLAVVYSSLSAKGNVYTQTVSAVKYFGTFGIGALEISPAGINPFGIGELIFGGTARIKVFGQTSLDARYTTATGGGLGLGIMSKL